MRKLTGMLVAVALLLLAGPVAVAQEATPGSGSPTAEPSLLAGLGFPDLVVPYDGTDFTPPSEVAAGRYRLVLENSSAIGATIELYQPPEGMTAADVITELEAAQTEEGAPDIFFEMVAGGGVVTEPGTTNDAIVTLTPGEWIFNLFAIDPAGEGEDSNSGKVVNVTGELGSLTDPEAAVTVTLLEMAIELPDTVAPGPQIWKVENTGAFPHFLVIESYPEPVTAEQVQATLDMFFGIPGTPAATPIVPLDPEQFVTHLDTPIFSTGQANWYEVDLAPGQYIAFCFLEGPGDVPAHAALGMFKVFTVE
jgi:hypothetical protein